MLCKTFTDRHVYLVGIHGIPQDKDPLCQVYTEGNGGKRKDKTTPAESKTKNNSDSEIAANMYCAEVLNIVHELGLFLGTGTFLGKQDSLDVGQDATLSNSNASKEFVQLLIVPVQK